MNKDGLLFPMLSLTSVKPRKEPSLLLLGSMTTNRRNSINKTITTMKTTFLGRLSLRSIIIHNTIKRLMTAALTSTKGAMTRTFLLELPSNILSKPTRQTTFHRTSTVSVVSRRCGATINRIAIPTIDKTASIVVPILIISAINLSLLPMVRST